MPENDKSQHNPKYCELEHLLEKMAKESENKAFYISFRQHYNALCVNSKKSIRIKHLSEESKKKRAKCWLHPYITLSICLEKGFISCGMDDLNPTEATAKIAE
ncbi:hypothetical protein AOH205_08260 [Helicobacter pylori]